MSGDAEVRPSEPEGGPAPHAVDERQRRAPERGAEVAELGSLVGELVDLATVGRADEVDEMMHPGVQFKGQIIVNADKGVDFRLVRKVIWVGSAAYIENGTGGLDTRGGGR